MENEAFEKAMRRFSCILKSTGTVTTEEISGRHESTVEDVAFFDFGVVEEDGEGSSIKKGYDFRVWSYETTWWHVEFEDSGIVFFDSGLEVFVTSLVVEVVVSVMEGSDDGKTVASWDWFQGEVC